MCTRFARVRLLSALAASLLAPASASAQWSAWASEGGVLTSPVAVGSNADGRLEAFVRGSDDALWHKWQTAPSNGWAGWASEGGTLTSNLAVGRNADGRLEVFGRGSDQALWHMWQIAPNAAWSAWASLGGQITTDPAVAQNADGRLEVFARGTDDALWHVWQTAPGGGWSGWASEGGTLSSNVAVGTNADGRLEVFGRGSNNALWHNSQSAPNGGWTGWASLGGTITTEPTLAQNADGRLEAFARGTDNALWHVWQTAPNGGWSAWASQGGQLTSSVAVGRNADGRLEAFARGTDDALWHKWQTAPNGGWSDWASRGGQLTTGPAVAQNADGRLEAFARGTDNALWHVWQTSLGAGGAGAQVRRSWQDFSQDPGRVASFARGVAVMKSRDGAPPGSPEYRTSWQYWSAMHYHFGPQPYTETVALARASAPQGLQPFFNGVLDLVQPSAPPNVAQRVWAKCQHGSRHFFTWHRMYLYYFERVLRAAAGDPNLRLPYWDYTSTAQLGFPQILGQPQLGGTTNPLYDVRRRSQSVQLSANSTNVDGMLQQASFSTFQSNVEGGPHGYVHCTVGAGCQIPLMGAVPAAGTDAVFWMHHANIDRIWQCWLEQGGQMPTDAAFLQQTYDFVDETGSLATLSVAQLLGPSSPIDYTYDNVLQCRRTAALVRPPAAFRAAALGAEPERTTLDSATAVAIDAPVKTLSLEVPRTGAPSDSLKNAFRVDRPAVPGAVELVLEGVTVDATPGVLFDVFLARKGGGERRYVGTLSFFGAGAHEHGAAAQGFDRSFDVTEALRSLVGPELSTDAVDVVFEATTGVADANPAEARAAFNAEAGLKIGKVELRVLK